MAEDRNHWRHHQWLKEIQPVGLVVTPPAMDRFGLVLPQQIMEEWERFQQITLQPKEYKNEDDQHLVDNFPLFAEDVLNWDLEDLAGGPKNPQIPDRFLPYLEDVQVHLKPTYVLLDPDAEEGDPAPLVITCEPLNTALDKPADHGDSGWRISPMNRFLRLLRESHCPAGLLCNGAFLRLIYAPKGETPGYIDFPVGEMAETLGRNMLAAMIMLLCENRLLTVAPQHRLTALMKESRKYQNEVSTKLAAQVQIALDQLLNGFQTADPNLISGASGNTCEHVYGGLLTVMMRLVFILYTEDRGLMPHSAVYTGSYSLAGLFERLREDETHYPDTMDQRFGAWSQLLTLFRMVYSGGHHQDLELAARYGQLFRPDAFPFLEGKKFGEAWSQLETLVPPAVPDSAVLAVLRNLLVLDGERLSYRGLDVETIGSVYEAMMGFEIEQANAPSLALGKFSVVVDLNQLLAQKPADRKKYLKAEAGLDLSPTLTKAVRNAGTRDQLIEALQPRVSKRRPHVIQAGGLFLQPGQERRKTGSHYTPRELTEPIVRHTLEPVLADLGKHPTAEQILELKVCDPAMGSGAFLVEVCRYLGDQLVAAWDYHKTRVQVPEDEDRHVYARRLVAGRCIYGIDKNPFAVSLAKLSLWLVTLAKNQPFTFLDHALKCGDTLLGLTRDQITSFTWHEQKDAGPLADLIGTLKVVSLTRRQIHDLGDGDHMAKRELHRQAEDKLDEPRLVGDLILAAFFKHKKTKEREETLVAYQDKLIAFFNGKLERGELEAIRNELLHDPEPQRPFHIELEFPEVFERDQPGFEAFVGNPPFVTGKRISTTFSDAYLAWLLTLHNDSHGNGDLVAHFFRRAFYLSREKSAMGLIATNSIGQGDTRQTGLSWICQNGGLIFRATRRFKWPGVAAVVVSIVHISKGFLQDKGCSLDQHKVPAISAFLVKGKMHTNPISLSSNFGLSYIGSKIYGQGFLFEGHNDLLDRTKLDYMEQIIRKRSDSKQLIFPYIGGAELNTSPHLGFRRYVINFGDKSFKEASDFPELLAIVREKVFPLRRLQKRKALRDKWWLFGERQKGLYRKVSVLPRVLAISEVTTHLAFAFLPNNYIYAHTLKLICLHDFPSFCTLQSNFHETWARAFGSSMKDDLRYTPSDCFETYPFPPNWEQNQELEEAGKTYFEWRAKWMVDHNLGMTKTYNLYHNKEEADNPDMETLRGLHRAMDQAVLKAYGWENEVTLEYDYILDYEEEETNSKKKKPWRYRWTDDVRDQVLGLLLELNQQRADEEKAEREKVDAAALKEKADKTLIQAMKAPRKPAKPKKTDTKDAPLLPGME